MTGRERLVVKIPTENPQPARADAARPGTAGHAAPGSGGPGGGRVVTAEGIVVYPPRQAGDRWRAVWREPDGSRRQCQAVTEGRLAARLVPVAERLTADAPNMLRTGAELIGFYLSADRLPVERQWSRRHADTQRYLCERFVAPVIDGLACQDIKVADVQAVLNAAPTAVLGRKVQACASALVGAGIAGGYLANPRLAQVHWQPRGRPAGPARGAVAGESALFVDPGEVPGEQDVALLGKVLAARGWLLELVACFAAYSGLRWGELAALTASQIDQSTRQVVADRKVVEVRGHLYIEAPKGRKCRRTIYPRRTPAGWPLADHVARRAREVIAAW